MREGRSFVVNFFGGGCRLWLMTKDKAWLDVLLVVQEDEFFSRSKSGAIWGTVYFQVCENQFFPGQGWTDLVAAFVGVWVEGLLRVAEGISQKERVAFFDGPFAVDVSMPQKGFLSLNFVRDEKPVLSKTVDIMHLLAHGHSVPGNSCHYANTASGATGIPRP
jgi:hypothetical protein